MSESEMSKWFKPSMLQHWYISKFIERIFKPIKDGQEVIKTYLETWHKVYRDRN